MEQKLKVREMAYDLMPPLVIIYDKIEDTKHLGHATVKLYSTSQIVNYGLTIIKNTNNFETGIHTWMLVGFETPPFLQLNNLPASESGTLGGCEP